MSVKERLICYLEFKGISKSEFGRRIGVSVSYVTSMVNSIQPAKIEKIKECFPELNTSWLLTGEGEMIKGTKKSAPDGGALYTAPLLPISAQGGKLNDFIVSVKPEECEMVVSPIRDVDFAMTVSGDSMAPEYPNGSQILIKKIDGSKFIEWGRVYVLDTCNGSVIKKVMPPMEGGKGQVKCVSINAEYPPFEVSLADVYGIYRVLMCMSLK